MDTSDAELVKAVRNTPALYDPTNPDFKFTQRKEEIWAETASYLGITVSDLKRRWTCLRDKYTRELKQRRQDKIKYEPSMFFDTMDFLRKFVRRRSERKSIICNVKSESKSPKKNSMKLQKLDSSWEENLPDSFPKNEIITNSTTSAMESEPFENVMDIVQDDERSSYGCETYEEYHIEEESISTALPLKSKDLKNDTMQKFSPVPSSGNPLDVPLHDSLRQYCDNEDDFFCKSLSGYLANLRRVNKIKAKVEIFQIIQKYVEIEETSNN